MRETSVLKGLILYDALTEKPFFGFVEAFARERHGG